MNPSHLFGCCCCRRRSGDSADCRVREWIRSEQMNPCVSGGHPGRSRVRAGLFVVMMMIGMRDEVRRRRDETACVSRVCIRQETWEQMGDPMKERVRSGERADDHSFITRFESASRRPNDWHPLTELTKPRNGDHWLQPCSTNPHTQRKNDGEKQCVRERSEAPLLSPPLSLLIPNICVH